MRRRKLVQTSVSIDDDQRISALTNDDSSGLEECFRNMELTPFHHFPSHREVEHSSCRQEKQKKIDGWDPSYESKRSSHTFVLYLTHCDVGGETLLLRRVPGKRCNLTSDENALATVRPRRGRILVSTAPYHCFTLLTAKLNKKLSSYQIFPHNCPHAGSAVLHVSKLLLRGEMI